MRYSVVMPVYNKALYVEAAVNSALSQALLYELIIVDDGSTDGSGDICDRLAQKDKRIKLVHQKNSGVSAARNAGIKLISGDYACFLDGDDLFCEGFFEEAEKILEENPTDIVFFSLEKRFTDRTPIAIGSPLVGEADWRRVSDIFYNYQRDTGFFGFVSGKLVRSDIIKSEQFDVNIKLAEDLDYWFRIYAKAKRLYFSDFCCFIYNYGAENSSYYAKVDYFEQLALRLKYKDFLVKMKLPFDSAELGALINRYKYFCIFYADAQIDAAKRLRSYEYLPIKGEYGVLGFEKAVLWLCSNGMSAVAALLIKTKKCLGRVKRWIRRK